MNEIGKKVSVDLYSAQMKWVAWYLPIVYAFYFALFLFLNEPEIRSMSLLTFTFQTATIFMLVCGILSSLGFLPMYVKHGVTRKAYFQGALLSSIGLAFTIIGITAIVAWMIGLLKLNIFTEVMLSSGINSWFLTSIAYIIVVMIYFLVGWLIGSAFTRYGGSGGFVSIIGAFIIVSLNDLLWSFNTPKPFGLVNLNIGVPHVAIAIIASIAIAGITTIFVHKIVKDIPIKIG